MTDINTRLDKLLCELIDERITDLHFDINHRQKRMIFRRHKRNIKMKEMEDLNYYDYLKYIASLDLIQSNLPQTGNFTYIVNERTYYFRLAVMETPLRKSAVLRVLNMNPIRDLKACVQDEKVYQKLLTISEFSQGIVLFCGATGSGKSTTMHHFLKTLKHKQIYTLETPIEIFDDDFIQIETNKNLDFNTALSQLLRHDPDIIALGEVRFESELHALLRAGLSGHAVCSTLHAGKSEDVIARLLDLGARPYDLLHGLRAVVYQDLKLDKKGEVKIAFKVQTGKILQRKILEAEK